MCKDVTARRHSQKAHAAMATGCSAGTNNVAIHSLLTGVCILTKSQDWHTTKLLFRSVIHKQYQQRLTIFIWSKHPLWQYYPSLWSTGRAASQPHCHKQQMPKRHSLPDIMTMHLMLWRSCNLSRLSVMTIQADGKQNHTIVNLTRTKHNTAGHHTNFQECTRALTGRHLLH